MRVKNCENKSFSGRRPPINGTFIFFFSKKLIAELVSQLPNKNIAAAQHMPPAAFLYAVCKAKSKPVSRVLSWTIIYLVRPSPGGSSLERENGGPP